MKILFAAVIIFVFLCLCARGGWRTAIERLDGEGQEPNRVDYFLILLAVGVTIAACIRMFGG